MLTPIVETAEARTCWHGRRIESRNVSRISSASTGTQRLSACLLRGQSSCTRRIACALKRTNRLHCHVRLCPWTCERIAEVRLVCAVYPRSSDFDEKVTLPRLEKGKGRIWSQIPWALPLGRVGLHPYPSSRRRKVRAHREVKARKIATSCRWRGVRGDVKRSTMRARCWMWIASRSSPEIFDTRNLQLAGPVRVSGLESC